MSKRARGIPIVGAVICINLIGISARAAFNFTAQTRSVTAHTHGPAGDLTQTFSASNFGAFNQTAQVTDNPGGGFATQHQQSTLSSTVISIVGGFSGRYPVFVNSGIADGNSTAKVTFTIPATTDVDLTAQADFDDPAHFLVGSVVLSGPNTSINWYVTHGVNPPPWPTGGHAQHLVLAPGSYTLSTSFDSQLVAEGGGVSLGTVGGFDVELTQSVPEPASAAAGAMLAGSLLFSRPPRIRPPR